MRILIALLTLASSFCFAQPIQPIQPSYRNPIPILSVQQNATCRIDSISNGHIVPLDGSRIGVGQTAQIVVTANVDRMFQVVINPMNHILPQGPTFKIENSAQVIQGANTGQHSTDTNSDKITIFMNQQGQSVIAVNATAISQTGFLPPGRYELNYRVQCIPLN
jgi:hypothetical protein